MPFLFIYFILLPKVLIFTRKEGKKKGEGEAWKRFVKFPVLDIY